MLLKHKGVAEIFMLYVHDADESFPTNMSAFARNTKKLGMPWLAWTGRFR